MSTLLNAPADEKKPLPHTVEFFTAAAPPPEAVLAAMKEAGFNVTHVYGLTETYGPATTNEWHAAWDKLPLAEQAAKKARQGVRYVPLEALDVLDPDTMQPVPRDGETLGEVMFRGNVVMKGYLKNKASSDKAFAGGWFHSGDLGVMHPDGYIQLKDRSKDIIISGGENISSIEVEDALYKHPAVQAAAVVAKPDEKWGETPCAFVELKPGQSATDRRAGRVVQEQSRRLQGAALRGVRRIAEDQHREDSEVQIARDGEGSLIARARSGPGAQQRVRASSTRYAVAFLLLAWHALRAPIDKPLSTTPELTTAIGGYRRLSGVTMRSKSIRLTREPEAGPGCPDRSRSATGPAARRTARAVAERRVELGLAGRRAAGAAAAEVLRLLLEVEFRNLVVRCCRSRPRRRA